MMCSFWLRRRDYAHRFLLAKPSADLGITFIAFAVLVATTADFVPCTNFVCDGWVDFRTEHSHPVSPLISTELCGEHCQRGIHEYWGTFLAKPESGIRLFHVILATLVRSIYRGVASCVIHTLPCKAPPVGAPCAFSALRYT